MTGRADERPYAPPAPETGPAVTSANLAAQAEKADEKPDAEPKKPAAKRGSAKN